MPQIIVTAHDNETTVTLRERINVSDFESERFAANLLERLDWAVRDAREAEDSPAVPRRRERPAEGLITGARRRRGVRDPEPELEPEPEPVGSA